MQSTGAQFTVWPEILLEGQQRIVPQREERPTQRCKDLEFIVRPFDRGKNVT